MVKFRYKVEREVQSHYAIYKRKLQTRTTVGGGVVSTDTLNSEAIIDNIGDYNSKSMGIL